MSLLENIPEDGSPRVIVVKPDIPGPTSPRTNGTRKAGKGPLYDPSLVFVLELATVLALRDNETVRELAKDVTDALASVIRDTSKHHPVVVARSVYYLLSLLKASNVSLQPCDPCSLLICEGLRLHTRAGPPSHFLEL
jgi:brefeldin A-resistance guanine nucleotide exchange factor 1